MENAVEAAISLSLSRGGKKDRRGVGRGAVRESRINLNIDMTLPESRPRSTERR